MLTYGEICARADEVRKNAGTAVRPGPGKFEGNDDRVLAENLWEASLDGWTEEQGGSVDEGGWFGRIGRFILREDGYGFFDVEDHETEEDARAAFRVLEEDDNSQ